MAYDYRVRTAYEVDDKASGKIAKMADAAKSAAGHFDSLAMSGLKLGSIMATGAATAAVAALKHGLVNVNATMEETKLGFATTFNMLGNTGIDNGLTLAGDLVEQIRKDAKELPGEFGDFVNMAQLLTAPLLNAGKGIEDIRNTTRQTVVAAAALKVPFEQAAREMAMLIEGHAGGHNLLGNKIGITTHTMIKSAKGGDVEFNKATSEERIAHLNKLLVKGDESLGHFGRSWAGLTSTMVDSMKQFLGRATLPLFERLKGNVASINKLMDSPKFTELADSLGRGLLRAHDGVMVAVSYISEHWDNIKETGREWGEAILGMLKAALPIVEKLGDLLANEMQDPAKLVKELLAARLALGALSNPAVLSGIGSAVMGPGTGAAATEAAAGAGAGAGAAGAVAGGAAAAAAVALVALAGAVDVLTPNITNTGEAFTQMQMWGQEVWRDIKENFGAAITETTAFLKDLWVAIKPVVDVIGIALLGAIDGAILAFRAVLAPLRLLASAVAWVVKQIPGFGDGADTPEEGADGYAGEDHKSYKAPKKKGLADVKPKDMSKLHAELAAIDAMEAAKKSAKLHGAGKTTVNNTNYFTVLQENDPERFAVQVATYLDKVTRNPVRPAGAPTFLTK